MNVAHRAEIAGTNDQAGRNQPASISADPRSANLQRFDVRPKYREYIHEMMGMAAIHCGLAQTYAEIGDDAGLQYSLMRFRGYARAALETMNDLKKVSGAANLNGEGA